MNSFRSRTKNHILPMLSFFSAVEIHRAVDRLVCGTAVPLHLQLALGSATYHSETRRKYVGSAQATAKSWSVALRSKLALFRLRSTHTPAPGLAIMPAAAATRPSEDYKDATSMKDEASLLEGLITYVDIREPNWRWKQLPYWSVALCIYQFMWPEHRAATFEWDWMLFILVRNLAIMLIWYGGWHHFLYVKRSLPIETKFNSKYPPESQHYRDAFWTTVGFAIGSAVEIGFCHLWATNKLPRLEPLGSPLAFLALIPFQAFYADCASARTPHLDTAPHNLDTVRSASAGDFSDPKLAPLVLLPSLRSRSSLLLYPSVAAFSWALQVRALSAPQVLQHRGLVRLCHAPSRAGQHINTLNTNFSPSRLRSLTKLLDFPRQAQDSRNDRSFTGTRTRRWCT
jgi:hypothetical protein